MTSTIHNVIANVHIAAYVEFKSREEVNTSLAEATKSAIGFSLQQELVVTQQRPQGVACAGRHAARVQPLKRAVRVLPPARETIIQISTKKKRDVVVIAAVEEVIDHLLEICVPEGRVTLRTNGRCG